MCGIFGFTGPARPGLLESMATSLRHRGPDGTGVWEGKGISLGATRLAIVDLEHGAQPVESEDGAVRAVMNGEIYNHLELRAELREAGHRFRSHHSDTEIVPHLYEQHELGLLDRLNGMFAVALWDEKKRRLLLARDHAGVKPLYFSVLPGGGIVFASEIKALLVHPEIRKAPDFRALHHYFTFKNVPAPLTAFAGIEQLRAGEYLRYGDDGLERKFWWNPPSGEDEALEERAAAGRLLELIDDSVRLQSEADVEVGAFLSGGLDSSTVVALMSRHRKRKLKTFTLVYDEEIERKAPDRAAAREVAARFGTDHYESLMTPRRLVEELDGIVGAFDEPFGGCISTYFLAQLASRHVKVVLTGDGADELFGSYLPHRTAALASKGEELERRMGQYTFSEPEKRGLYSSAMLDYVESTDSSRLVEEVLKSAGTSDPLNRMLLLDQRTLLPDQVLAFTDRLSMASSIEARPPFLDPRVMKLAARVRGTLKIRDGRVKHILKEAVLPRLPESIVNRPKEGFVLPLSLWMTGELEDFVFETLHPNRLARHGLFRPDAVRELLSRDEGQVKVWTLLMFQLWWERYIG